MKWYFCSVMLCGSRKYEVSDWGGVEEDDKNKYSLLSVEKQIEEICHGRINDNHSFVNEEWFSGLVVEL